MRDTSLFDKGAEGLDHCLLLRLGITWLRHRDAFQVGRRDYEVDSNAYRVDGNVYRVDINVYRADR
jgi:hypothetical protein